MKILLAFIVVIILSSCSNQIENYKTSKPTFDIKTYFDGRSIAWGMVQDFNNKVTRRFCVELVGTWQGDQGTLDEVFYFDDGEITTRLWQLTKLSDGQYQGTAGDVEGIAVGQHQGFAFHWQYYLNVPVGDETYKFFMDDWMYQLDEERVFNKTTMNKFGVAVAEITLFFDKNTSAQNCQQS